ncbi:MAG: DUF4168 domain-containing protein [Cyanobacteria bacterium]|nr:DUF4168 domain-containing protein [Cyanobacteriota bacterium]MDW8200793.1 DUF4168 domain-containing protein [Cyanobacteriota bacterium SKYGB_h_bin112]
MTNWANCCWLGDKHRAVVIPQAMSTIAGFCRLFQQSVITFSSSVKLMLHLLAITGITLVIEPASAHQATPILWNANSRQAITVAQTPDRPVTDEEVRRYASSVLTMEPLRQTAYTEIQRIMGTDNVPMIVCHPPQALNGLPADIRLIATDFCHQSKRIVEGSGLSVSRFNDITLRLEEDSGLRQRIQAELIRLQQQLLQPKRRGG